MQLKFKEFIKSCLILFSTSRLASTVQIVMLLSVILTYPLVFYVLVELTWPPMERRVKVVSLQKVAEYAFRVLLVLFTCKFQQVYRLWLISLKFRFLISQLVLFSFISWVRATPGARYFFRWIILRHNTRTNFPSYFFFVYELGGGIWNSSLENVERLNFTPPRYDGLPGWDVCEFIRNIIRHLTLMTIVFRIYPLMPRYQCYSVLNYSSISKFARDTLQLKFRILTQDVIGKIRLKEIPIVQACM